MEELDHLVYANRGIFNHWQRIIFPGFQPIGPLHVASMCGNICWVKQLLDRGEKPDELFPGPNASDFNALQALASSSLRNVDILKALLERCGPNCDINTETKSMASAFHLWVQLDPTIDNVQRLLELGGDPTRVGKYKWNAFHHFSCSGSEPEAFDNRATPLLILLNTRQTPLNLLQAFVR
ncbi:hypothetical protein F4678DRAFT_454733 [Xylaria arbuscula]|nr:hypothetical protein F4678DRAFT_454733 [Xylaria arbuscula]